jgi:hypothetical protein
MEKTLKCLMRWRVGTATKRTLITEIQTIRMQTQKEDKQLAKLR